MKSNRSRNLVNLANGNVNNSIDKNCGLGYEDEENVYWKPCKYYFVIKNFVIKSNICL